LTDRLSLALEPGNDKRWQGMALIEHRGTRRYCRPDEGQAKGSAMSNRVINLYSDTQSRPTPAMRQAMAEAEVGDEQRGADPTVNALCARVATLLGKEAAVFLPSGTMCNEIAILVHCRHGDEIICERNCHLIVAEGGAPAALAGVMMYQIDGDRGIFTAEQVRAATRDRNRYAPRSRLVSVEQTSNAGGGSVWPLATIEAVAEAAREAGLALHMDGARLMNAAVASGVAAADFARPFDTVWIDLSKGLGCPVGGVLAGSKDAIDEAWIWKQRLGGALRQAGIVAAAGLYALDHNVERLADDHANAKAFAEAIAEVPGLALDPASVETNLVYFDVTAPGLDAEALQARLAERGVDIGAMGEYRMRAVTYLDVGRDEVMTAAAMVADVMAELAAPAARGAG
jgi:threonine aldolase